MFSVGPPEPETIGRPDGLDSFMNFREMLNCCGLTRLGLTIAHFFVVSFM